jgi:hypothetical protein
MRREINSRIKRHRCGRDFVFAGKVEVKENSKFQITKLLSKKKAGKVHRDIHNSNAAIQGYLFQWGSGNHHTKILARGSQIMNNIFVMLTSQP